MLLTQQHHTRDILYTRVMPSADCNTDHRLVRCKVAFISKSRSKRKGPQTKKLQMHELVDPRGKTMSKSSWKIDFIS